MIIVIDQYVFKVFFEMITLPLTYVIVYFLNKHEVPLAINYVDLSKQPANLDSNN